MKRMLTTIAAIIVAAGLGGAVLAVNNVDSSRTTQLQHRMAQLQVQVTESHRLVHELTGMVNNLNLPSDPLSAYNQECALNGSSLTWLPSADVSNASNATLWFPCTDSASTTPQPGA